MPTYDYRCRSCDVEFETFHGMLETKPVPCVECGSIETSKVPTACGIVVHNSGSIRAAGDRHRRRTDAKQDLLENHGVEKVNPLGPNTFDSVYNDIKSTGSLTRDQMQERRAKENARVKKKQKDWLKKAKKRTPERWRFKKQKKAEEAAAKRKIVL